MADVNTFEEKTPPSRSHLLHGIIPMATTTTNLDNGNTDYSDFFDIRHFSKVVGACYADQNLTLTLQFSSDGANVDHEESVTVTADTADAGFEISVMLPYVRLSLANASGSNTTTLRCWVGVRSVT